MTLKRLTQKRNTNSLAIDDKVLSDWFDKADEIELEIKSGEKFRIDISDLVLEGKKRNGKWCVPIEFWEPVEK